MTRQVEVHSRMDLIKDFIQESQENLDRLDQHFVKPQTERASERGFPGYRSGEWRAANRGQRDGRNEREYPGNRQECQ